MPKDIVISGKSNYSTNSIAFPQQYRSQNLIYCGSRAFWDEKKTKRERDRKGEREIERGRKGEREREREQEEGKREEMKSSKAD